MSPESHVHDPGTLHTSAASLASLIADNNRLRDRIAELESRLDDAEEKML